MHIWLNLKSAKGKEGALKYFEDEVKANDKNDVIWASLGKIYMNVFQYYDKAEKAFKIRGEN